MSLTDLKLQLHYIELPVVKELYIFYYSMVKLIERRVPYFNQFICKRLS